MNAGRAEALKNTFERREREGGAQDAKTFLMV
jgi:hypothetical protein